MSKKPIAFGKISFNLAKSNEPEKNEEPPPAPAVEGFGTFGRTPIKDQGKEIEEIAEDLESQHVHQVMGIRNFGKKAKNFDIEEMLEQAKKAAREAAKRKVETAPDPEPAESSTKVDEDEDDDLIGKKHCHFLCERFLFHQKLQYCVITYYNPDFFTVACRP